MCEHFSHRHVEGKMNSSFCFFFAHSFHSLWERNGDSLGGSIFSLLVVYSFQFPVVLDELRWYHQLFEEDVILVQSVPRNNPSFCLLAHFFHGEVAVTCHGDGLSLSHGDHLSLCHGNVLFLCLVSSLSIVLLMGGSVDPCLSGRVKWM